MRNSPLKSQKVRVLREDIEMDRLREKRDYLDEWSLRKSG
jgi:hypothetical protein